MKIIPLGEGSFTVDQSKEFIPFQMGKDELQERARGSLLVEIQPFVVITSEDVLLLDAGLGFEIDGMLQLHKNLLLNGIDPQSVTKVLMSHLHKDHIGGIGYFKEGKKQLAFPSAKHYIQREEFEFAFSGKSSSYTPESLQMLVHSKQLNLLDGNGVIEGYIKYEVTGAHSRYHQVFTIVDGGERVFFGGDDAPQLQQMKSRFVAKYDFDGKKCMQLRQEWWERGNNEGWTFLFYHDIKSPIYNSNVQ
jgi:glyoxylase-like metal-dependent hydrolase (beta-lactamase superfamily II)